AQAELIIEHFGFTPLSCIDDIINAVNDILYQATSSLERFITKEMGECPEAEQGIHQIETLLENAVDKYFDIFELYSLRNIFSIPPDANITLPHHEVS
ncbi:centromere protein Mis12, partial [Dimargaris cristalligena]